MNYQGKKAAFYTLGCKLNYAETSTISHTMEEAGFSMVDFDAKADKYLLELDTVALRSGTYYLYLIVNDEVVHLQELEVK